MANYIATIGMKNDFALDSFDALETEYIEEKEVLITNQPSKFHAHKTALMKHCNSDQEVLKLTENGNVVFSLETGFI